MFPFHARSGTTEAGALDKVVWRLLDTPFYDRQVALMEALRAGEIRLSEASDVLLTVDRIESLSRSVRPVVPVRAHPAAASPSEPNWPQDGRRAAGE